MILSRNAEYATDIEYFRMPFEDELEYITELWREYAVYDDFIKKYDRLISNSKMGD